jgi:hypothetical protein
MGSGYCKQPSASPGSQRHLDGKPLHRQPRAWVPISGFESHPFCGGGLFSFLGVSDPKLRSFESPVFAGEAETGVRANHSLAW